MFLHILKSPQKEAFTDRFMLVEKGHSVSQLCMVVELWVLPNICLCRNFSYSKTKVFQPISAYTYTNYTKFWPDDYSEFVFFNSCLCLFPGWDLLKWFVSFFRLGPNKVCIEALVQVLLQPEPWVGTFEHGWNQGRSQAIAGRYKYLHANSHVSF